MGATSKEQIAEALLQEAEDKKISCEQALALAERLGVEPRLIGEAADAQQVKIVECQLHCFGWRARD